MKKLFLLFAIACFLCTGTVYATNITISDENYSTGDWHQDTTDGWVKSMENDEVEPGMAHGQQWDLEGFFTNGKKLSLVGGYNFKDGYNEIYSGDIFIDVTNDAVYGDIHGDLANGNHSVLNTYGYDYVLDLHWPSISNSWKYTYDVYAIDSYTTVQTAFYAQNQGSSPWRYETGGTRKILDGVTFQYTADTDRYDNEFGSIDTHNELIVDLGFLLDELGTDSVNFIAHYTMECGNDNLMGRGTIPNPEPATMLLLGFGLIGIAGLYRKKQK